MEIFASKSSEKTIMAKSEISSNKSSINCSFRKDKIVKKLKVELKALQVIS